MAITWTDDNTSINTCENKGDWSGSGFSNPDDNNNGSATPIFREGTGCMQATCASNTTGYWYDTIAVNLNNLALVTWIWFSGPTELAMFGYFSVRIYDGTNWIDYDYLPDMQVLDVGGWYPAVLYPTPSGESHITNSGTPAAAGIDEIRILADQTDTNYDVKLVGWDYIHSLSYVGAGGDTITLEDFVLRDAANNFGVITQKGSTFQSQTKLRYGGTGATVVDESNKTLTFKGANEDHKVGVVFVSGGTSISYKVTDMVFNWDYNSETGHAAYSYIGVNPGTFQLTGCAFNKFPDFEMPTHGILKWAKNCKFNGGRAINLKDLVFEENTISNSLATGVFYTGAGWTRRAKNNTYLNNADAIEVDTVGNLTLDGDTFSGNTTDIHFSGNSPTINAGSFVTGNAYKIATVGTTDFTAIGAASNTVGEKFIATGAGSGTGTAYHILLIQATNGANPTTSRSTGTNGDVLINNPVTHRLYGLADNTEVTYTKRGASNHNNNNGSTVAGSRVFTDSATNFGATDSKKGNLLVIGIGADAGRYYIVSNTSTTLTLDTEMTATASALNYNIYSEDDDIVLFHVENSSGGDTEYSYNYQAGLYVDIMIFHINYDDIVFTDVELTSSSVDVPVQQSASAFYLNPA